MASKNVIFLREKANKHSIRALAAAFEVHYPLRGYSAHLPRLKDLPDLSKSLILCSFTSSKAGYYFELAETIRGLYPKAFLACGGAHPSAKEGECLKYFDYVCAGEGENALKDIVDAFDADERVNRVFRNSTPVNLDDFPAFPRRSPYLGPLEIVRGCAGGCRYCQTPKLFGGKIRSRSPEFIASEFAFAASKVKAAIDARFLAPDASMYMYDGSLNLAAVEKMFTLVKEKIGNGRIFFGSFPSELDPARVTGGLVDIMKRLCDNKTVIIGLQSGSSRMLKLMNRSATPEDCSNAAELLLAAGYKVVVDFIFGLPDEDDESALESIGWIEEWKDRVVVHAHPFMPLPGTEWESKQPGAVPDFLLKYLRSLEGQGRIFGRYN